MLRKSLVMLSTVGAVAAMYASASGSALSGTASCDTPFTYAIGTITPPLPAQTPSARLSKFEFLPDLGSCVADDPAVAIARISVKSVIPRGTSCATEFSEDDDASTLHFRNARVRIKWLGRDGETYAASKAGIAAMSIEETPASAYVLRIVSDPIRAGSFKGRTITINATIRNVGDLATQCFSPTGALSQIEFSPIALFVQ